MLPQLVLLSPNLIDCVCVAWAMMLRPKYWCVEMVEKYEALMDGIQNFSVRRSEENRGDLAPLVVTTVLVLYLCNHPYAKEIPEKLEV